MRCAPPDSTTIESLQYCCSLAQESFYRRHYDLRRKRTPAADSLDIAPRGQDSSRDSRIALPARNADGCRGSWLPFSAGRAAASCQKPARKQGHLWPSRPSLTVGLLTPALTPALL